MTESHSEDFDRVYEERVPDFDQFINIAFIGKVSTGKSSLINAIFERSRNDTIVDVGATSGVTTNVKSFKLDDHVLIIDSPGLDDIQDENSEETRNFLKNIDLGVLVVTGSADKSQKETYDKLLKYSEKVVVVLNKVDEWDDLEESALTEVIEQWKNDLGADHVFPTCTKGYDPKMKKSAPMDIRGVKELNEEIFDFFREKGKDILLAKHLGDKSKYATRIISGALVAVGAEAFIPGSAVYITTTQVVAITSLYYIYTGEVMGKGNALSLLPLFMGESVGLTVFLWVKSFLPPTGVVDVAAAGVAITVTFAMLAAVNSILEAGIKLEKAEQLKKKFKDYKASSSITEKIILAIKNGGNINDIIHKFLYK